ncbi:MAG: acyl-CoA dehydrogenase [Gammaproteobacteria bacterium]|nr:acyl-CoA dehydrogenase [Gammaproteobacteria bacterium]
MDFSHSGKVEALRARLEAFMEDHVVPRRAEWRAAAERGEYPVPFVEDLKALARRLGLWNLFLPSLRDDEPGTRLTNLEYAPLAEIMGRIPWASEVFNCNAPDTGNMELLHMFGTAAQRREWLEPLLDGQIRSAFAMTEPDVASSDATNIQTTIARDGDDYVIDGRKWYITNAADPRCRILIVMGKTDPSAPAYRQQSMVLVPKATPGVEVLRNVTVMHHHSPHGHCELLFRGVRVPTANLLGAEGQGFDMAQARLGPGRVHHCMRSIGEAELALQLMVQRSRERRAFGQSLCDHGVIADWIAISRLEIEQARLLVLKTAWLIDTAGIEATRQHVAMIKAVVPSMLTRVADRAIQVFGAMGTGPDTPLAEFWTDGRALRIADGPDEVHRRSIARLELKASRDRGAALAAYLVPPAAGGPRHP